MYLGPLKLACFWAAEIRYGRSIAYPALALASYGRDGDNTKLMETKQG